MTRKSWKRTRPEELQRPKTVNPITQRPAHPSRETNSRWGRSDGEASTPEASSGNTQHAGLEDRAGTGFCGAAENPRGNRTLHAQNENGKPPMLLSENTRKSRALRKTQAAAEEKGARETKPTRRMKNSCPQKRIITRTKVLAARFGGG
jgi:hypothetical protein